MSISFRDLPQGWEVVNISEVTDVVPSVDPTKHPQTIINYIDISSIDNRRFEITESRKIAGAEAPSRARRAVRDGDVLFSNVRTYLRNIARVSNVEQPAVASTGFTVLRPNNRVLQDFLFRWVTTDEFIHLVTPKQTGTQYPATYDRVVRSQRIPLPPVAEQRRIVDLLDQIDQMRDAVAAGLASARSIIMTARRAVLAAACSGALTSRWRGDHRPAPCISMLQAKRSSDQHRLGRRYREPTLPSADTLPPIPDEWCWAALPELGELGRGKSKHRPRNHPSLFGGDYPFIQTGEVARSGGRITSHSQTYNDLGLAQSRIWPARTVCITIAANIADSALLTYPACFPDSVVGLIADEKIALPEYVELFMRTARRDLAAFAPATAQANINLAILSQVAVALPPLEEQREIVRRVEALFKVSEEILTNIDAVSSFLDRISQAALAKAFRGDLVS
ncbi:restriction endonuclease subunit S [Actinomadura sp. ATCC 31491]|uniref:Restriction endonuclease subunit S n=1 Tax=Actinomadura luzonensis TaxID=2805427 RepID=A0ABT0FM14_9ACTN|nr:restriction endonuclease subunit S [Actinomadura luzonensis]MCK2213347.1 restriction endonuclease subunit S [Actinomadura luzonensis]